MRLATIIVLAIALVAGPAMAGFLTAPAGYVSSETPDITLGGYIGSFDTYQDKYVFFSGRDVQIINNNGAVERTVYSFNETEYPGNFYGSFVKVAGDTAYIGESSFGTVKTVSLNGSPNASTLTTVGNNYDFAIDSMGRMFIIAGAADWMSTDIWMIGGSGSQTKVASFAGASGPITFDAAGNLYCGPYDYSGSATIYKWSSSQINASVNGGTTLGMGDASVVVSNIKNPSAFTTDNAGNLYFSSWAVSQGTIWKVSVVDQSVSEFSVVDPYYKSSGLTGLRFDSATGTLSTIGSLTESVRVWDDELQDWTYQNVYHTKIGTLAPVPEPSALAALGSMLGMALVVKRRRS